MAGILAGDPSHHGIMESSPYNFSHDKLEEADCIGSAWYLSRREIEENSPSRRDGIDLKKEAYFRKSYCTFLQDLGMRLKVPQVTIATAIVFCHRFFLRQSHAKNDKRTIATVCMFLAGKVEETPRPLKDVIIVSYEIINKKDPAAVQRIKQREVYEQQKELILLGERLVLATLGFDLNVHHPYKPLVEAIKKFKVAQNALAQVAWNFVNDGLRTSLCLQFKPHHIAAGAIFLAAKFLKVKLPSDGEVVWWQEFDVTPRQLEEVSNQMLELYEQNRATAPSHGTETEGSPAGGVNHRVPIKALAAFEEPPLHNKYVPVAGTTGVQHGVQTSSMARPVPDQSHIDKQNGAQRNVQNDSDDHGAKEPRGTLGDGKMESGFKDRRNHEPGNVAEASKSRSNHVPERPVEEAGMSIPGGPTEAQPQISGQSDGAPKGYSPMMDAMKKIDKDKVKAALEKRRKSRAEAARKTDIMDEDDLIERELESGIELAAEDERIRQERRHSWSKPPHRQGHGAENCSRGTETAVNAEEGELSTDAPGFRSPVPSGRKRNAVSPGKPYGGKDGYDLTHHHVPPSKHRDGLDDSRAVGRLERSERDHKRIGQENHV